MKTKPSLSSRIRLFLLLGLLSLDLARITPAASVFQASLSTPSGMAQLQFGRIYFQVEGDQVDFLAVVFPFGNWPTDLSPVLTVSGGSLQFTLGPATRESLYGTRTVADLNPFVPAPPWLPHSYDENGNPLYLDSPVIRLTDIYTGQFDLPAGFTDDLLAGLGRIDFNSTLGGDIQVVAVPEPTTSALLLLASLISWRRNRGAS